jgi:hypothetical protein
MLSSDPGRLRLSGVDLRSRWRRRLAVALTYGVYTVVMMAATEQAFPQTKIVMWVASVGIVLLGIFRDRGPVKSFNQPTSLMRSRIRSAMLRGLDKDAKRRYGAAFDELSEEKQKAIMGKVRGSAMRKYLDPEIVDPDWPDEREMVERNRASVRTLQFVATMTIVMAIGFTRGRFNHQPNHLVASALELMVIVLTLPKAIILWTANHPRDSEEIDLQRIEA